MTTYTLWKVGDNINICAAINEFCGGTSQFIYTNDINVTKQPDVCTPIFGTPGGCGLHLDNVELTFKLVNSSGTSQDNNCNPTQVYKTIGSIRTDSNGTVGISYTVTEQDRLDSINAAGTYNVMACITNSDGQVTASNISNSTSSITIEQATHLECIDGTCTIVTGTGTNTCTTEGSTTECAQPPSTATHYIDYNFTVLPQEFLNYVSTYITDISANLNYYIIPYLSSDVTYIETRYENGRFKIYINYTPVLGMNTLIDIPQAIADLAYLIAGIILFIIGAILVVVIPGYGIIIGPIVAVFGTFIAQWSITNLNTNINSTSTRGDLSAPDKILLINEYSNILKAKCLELQPGCDTGNCTSIQMIAYNTCLGANELAITTFTGRVNNNFDQSLYDDLKSQINLDNDCLTLGTCTPQEVKDRIIIRENNTTTYVNDQLNTAISNENAKCLIPIGSVCLLTRQTAKTLAYIGGGLAVGYIVYKIFVKNNK